MLSSNSNRQIKELIKLQNQAKYRKKSGMFVAEGAKLVTEAAHYGKLQKIYIAESSQGREEERIQPLLEEFPYEVVSEEVFAEITDTVTAGRFGIGADAQIYDGGNFEREQSTVFIVR